MVKVSKEDILSLQRDLAVSLVDLSKGELTSAQAEFISEKIMPTLDFNNPIIAHKGINYYAKEILSRLDISKLS